MLEQETPNYLVFGVQEFAPFLSVDAYRNTKLRTDVSVNDMADVALTWVVL